MGFETDEWGRRARGRATPRWLTVAVDLDRPIPDITTNGASNLLITVFAREQPLGRTVVPAPLDPMPGRSIADHLESFALARGRAAIRDALSAQSPRRLPTASVIVCTRDRPMHLERCLAALGDLALDDVDVVVVDNGAEGSVRRLTESFGARYLHEPVHGLDRARNRGLLHVDTEVVLFVDDDVRVTPHWAAHLLACFDDPVTVAATGLLLPTALDSAAQIAFERYSGFVRGWEHRVFDGSRLPATVAGNAGAGASLAFRREALLSMGGFAEELDAGRPTESGGDTYALYRVLRAGWRVRYEPKAVAYHAHRDTAEDLERTVAGYGTGVVSYMAKAALDDRDPVAALAAARWTLRRTAGLARSVRGGSSVPVGLAAAEVRGMLRALPRLAASRRTLQRHPPLVSGSGDWNPTIAWQGPPLASDLPARRVSVVIPTRNRRESVIHLLGELGKQDYPFGLTEIVVAVDGATDGTAEAIERRYAGRVTVIKGPGEGAAAARNRGAARASGDVILFLDDDVQPLHEVLISAHVAALERGHAAAVGPVHPRLSRMTVYGEMVYNWWAEMAGANRRGDPLTFTDVCAGNFSLTRAWFQRMGGFTPMPRREDWLLGWRLLAEGGSVGSAEGHVVHHTSSDPSEALYDRFEEGRGDVAFVEQVPSAYALLPIGNWNTFSPRRRWQVRSVVAQPDRFDRLRDLALRAQDRLDSLGMRDRAAQTMSLASQLAYWAGVGRAAGTERNWHQLAARGRRHTIVSEEPLELAMARSWVPPAPPVAEVPVTHHGTEIGVALLAWGGIPWSRRAFADAVAERFGRLSLEADALRRTAS